MENGRLAFQGNINDTIERYLDSNSFENKPLFDLSKTTEREGTGEMKYESVEILRNGHPSHSMAIGDDLTLRLTIKSTQKINSIFAIHFYTHDQTRLANIENTDSDFLIEPFEGTRTFDVTFKDIRLYPGKYKIGLWIGDNMSGQSIDLLRFCAQFTIADGSRIVYRNLPPTSGIFYYNPDWNIV